MGQERIAVVAVHGVADQPPKSTARYIADLLLHQDELRIGEFQEAEYRIPVEAVRTKGWSARQRTPFRPKLFDPRPPCCVPGQQDGGKDGGKVGGKVGGKEGGGSGGTPAGEADQAAAQDQSKHGDSGENSIEHKYMRNQLDHYKPLSGDKIYGSIVLSSATDGRCGVDVYEMYWADLSRLGTGLLRLFFEFFTFVFFICRIGRINLDFARYEYRDSWWWAAFGRVQASAETMLVLVIPIANLFMASLVTAVLPYQFEARGTVASVGLGIICFALIAAGMTLKRYRTNASWWPESLLLPAILGAAAAGGAHLLSAASPRAAFFCFMIAWWVGCLLLVGAAVRYYQKRQPGAVVWAVLIGLLATAFLLVELNNDKHAPYRGLNVAIAVAEWMIILLTIAWGLFFFFTLLSTLLGLLAPWLGCKRQDREDGRRAAFTGNLSIVLPGLVILALLMVLWAGINAAGARFLPEDLMHSPNALIEDAMTHGALIERSPTGLYPAREFLYHVIEMAGGPALCLVFVCLAVVIVAAFWALLPSVLAELRAIGADGSEWLGVALSRSYRRLGHVTFAIVLVVGVSAFIFFALGIIVDQPGTFPAIHRRAPMLMGRLAVMFDYLAGYSKPLLGVAGALTLIVVASFGSLRGLMLGFQRALDIALDVANWLRLHPADRNPTSRICARYGSLLRHICSQDAYKALVIVAHSQGTVITADLLRFLKIELAVERDPSLERLRSEMPVYLFTMGCPLRQLYSLRFPHLYAWARHRQTTWPGDKPEPAELLGVRVWSNGYASGDYVGRNLWYTEDADDVWTPGAPIARGSRREQCVGDGAHTKYWDAETNLVAEELVALIQTACDGAAPGSDAPDSENAGADANDTDTPS